MGYLPLCHICFTSSGKGAAVGYVFGTEMSATSYFLVFVLGSCLIYCCVIISVSVFDNCPMIAFVSQGYVLSSRCTQEYLRVTHLSNKVKF